EAHGIVSDDHKATETHGGRNVGYRFSWPSLVFALDLQLRISCSVLVCVVADNYHNAAYYDDTPEVQDKWICNYGTLILSNHRKTSALPKKTQQGEAEKN